jgi:hypothetical protein
MRAGIHRNSGQFVSIMETLRPDWMPSHVLCPNATALSGAMLSTSVLAVPGRADVGGSTQSRDIASMHTVMARILASSWSGVISTP